MAQLGTSATCCSPETQADCCEPAEKDGCCTPAGSACGCAAGEAERDDVAEQVPRRHGAAVS